MTIKSIEKILSAKSLGKPGGQIYRTISSLPAGVTSEKISSEATARGYGYRIMHGKIYVYAPD
ncbi:hypothetical protein ABIE62_002899 [Porphyrobacter sp. MBR-155]|jgi:hypothetical protein|uniref:hypothetical protein n=1 Tax=Porphyrobacter sp. MBR-155 TaxID=3156464 RepID=UPI003392BDA6